MWELKRKYVFKGVIEMKTALHIGGGESNYKNTDKPVIRNPDGYPFIPGSSLKGVFRSLVERLAASIPYVYSCRLIDSESPNGCPTTWQQQFSKDNANIKEHELIKKLEKEICSTCKLFGSPWTASKIFFQDMQLTTQSDITQVRDGVMIDRDSERAVDKHKFDFETVPPSSRFTMEITLENPNQTDLGLTSIGLNEFMSETAYLGGIKSRGLGHCKMTDLKVFELDLESDGKEERLKKYLLNSTTEEKMEEKEPTAFIQEGITALLNQ